MIKVTYSSDISSTVGVGGEIIKSASDLSKQASTIFKCEYEDLKPPKGMTGIHLVALGDSEAYPMNRNGDLFPKEACQKYYNTFVEHGHVFEHHRNKDPKKAIGQIKAAAYNPDMHRIELYIWADNDKAHDHLERLEKTGEVPFSMAARVPSDRCFSKGTKVLTSEGFKNIEDVRVGDIAVTAEANERRVTATMVNETTTLTRVSVRGIPEEIECTPNHPFNVVSHDKMRSCNGSTTGHIKRRHTPFDGTTKCASCGRSIDVSAEWKRADELENGDYIKEKIDNSSEVPVRGVSFAYLCGMYAGDGSLTWQISGHDKSGDLEKIVGISISASARDEDSVIVDRIKKAFLSCTGKEARVNCESEGKRALVVNLSDILFANRVSELVGAYSREKHIGAEILNWSLDEKAAFIAGFIDSDGHIATRNGSHSIRICSTNKGMLLSAQRLLWSLGIPASLCLGNKLENMRDGSGFVHKSSTYTLFFNRATRSMVEHSAKLRRDYHDEMAGRSSNVLLIEGYAYIPVSCARTFVCDPVSVYNFEVEGEHTYIAEGVGVHNCSVCGAIRERPGDKSECDHIKYQLGKIAEDGTQIGTYNDEPTWFDISFVGRPADRIAWNLKTASAMPEDLTLNSSVKQAEVEGYVLPDDLAIESDIAKHKYSVMKKLASAYDKCDAWLFGSGRPSNKRERYEFELRKLAGAELNDSSITNLRELDPADAFSALGDAGIIMNAKSFFKYAFGPDYKIVEKYVPFVEKEASNVIREAVDTSCCSEFCNYSKYDANKPGFLVYPVRSGINKELMKSAAAYGFGTNDAITHILSVMASGEEPIFNNHNIEKTAEVNDVNIAVAKKLAKKYAMYKIAGICAVMDGKCGQELNEDDVIFVSAAQDMKAN